MGLSLWAKGKKAPNPGPGRYDVPAPFGEGPHYTVKGRIKQRDPDPEPPIRSMTSTLSKKGSSFGYSAYTPKEFQTPGPTYSPPKFGTDGKKVAFRFKQREKPDENPGPGNYTISRELDTTPIAIGQGKRWDAVDPNSFSSPAEHPVPRSYPEEIPRKIGKFIPRPEPKRYGPGPAKYNMETNIIAVNTPIKIGSSLPIDPANGKPGPAEYSINRDLENVNAVPINLKGRPPLPHGDICDYPYHKLPDTIQPKKLSMGVRPETSYETISPGPIYDHASTLSKQSASIGSKIPILDPHKGIPGPGTYFKMPPSQKADPFQGFPGSANRTTIDEREASNLPGPADYKYTRDFEKFERGFYFTSRKFRDYTPDTDAPFHDIPSTLGGPMFTIGNKEDF